MNSKSPHPEWATKFRKPGTELRFINGHYYLYQVSSLYDPVTKKSKKITGKLLGKISQENGFVESDKNSLRKKILKEPKNISSREFGISKFIFDNNNDIIDNLKYHFPDFWLEISLMALFRLIYQSPIKNLQFYYKHSYLSFSQPGAHVQEKNMSAILRAVGKDRTGVIEFMRNFVKKSDYLLIDLTNVISKSNNIGIAQKGYNSHRVFDPQVNLMLILSANMREPVFYRVVPGNIREVKSFILTLKESGINESVLIADKGFYSEKNIKELHDNGLNYILPLRRNNKLVSYRPVMLTNRKGLHGYFKFDKRYVWFYKKKTGKNQLIIYLDEELKTREERDYLDRIESHPENYSFGEYKEREPAMGTIAILTSLTDKSAEEIYKAYKSRCEIEQMIDVMKNNIEADRTYMQNDDALQGWFFVNFLALIWHFRIYKLLSENNLLSKYSVKDFIIRLNEIKIANIDGIWYRCEINSKTEKFLKKLNISIT